MLLSTLHFQKRFILFLSIRIFPQYIFRNFFRAFRNLRCTGLPEFLTPSETVEDTDRIKPGIIGSADIILTIADHYDLLMILDFQIFERFFDNV